MSRTLKAVLLLLILISIPLGLVFFRPDLVLTTLARSSANQLGYEITLVQVSRLGPGRTVIDRLHLESDTLHIEISDLAVDYSPRGVLAGQLAAVEIAEVQLRALPAASPTGEEEETTLAWALATLDELPVDSLRLAKIIYLDAVAGIEAELSLENSPLQIAGSANFATAPQWQLEYRVHGLDQGRLEIDGNAYLQGAPVLTTNMQLQAIDEVVAVNADSTLFTNGLHTYLQQFLPASTVLFTETLSLQSRFDVQGLFATPSLSKLHLVVDSPNSRMHLAQESELGTSDMQLQLPLTLQGEITGDSPTLQLSLSEVYGTGSWRLDDSELQGETSLGNIQLHCQTQISCDLTSDWRSDVIQVRAGDLLADDLSFSGALRLNYANDEMRLSSEQIQIQLGSIASLSEPASMQLSTTLQLDAFEFRAGDVVSGGFNFNSSALSLENSLVDVTRPAYSGKLQLEEDVLTGILEIDLDQRLRLGIGLQHFFLRDTGDVVLQLAATEFTETEPLSSLLSPKQLDADLLAGQIEGLANISWSRQADESWRFGGPIALKLDRLSGYYADYFFVDLSTDLFAEATTPLGIQVANPAQATLGRIDIGLPLQNLSWQYRFDTLSKELQVDEFSTELLGGKLSVPAARYHPGGERQQIDVVLADLSVASMVGLADYPGIHADGLISGYLPFVLEGDTLTIERGLVGALKPGGSIRYTPTTAAPSGNASMRLVNEALANYQYQTMNTEVYYDADGELLLSVQLHGRNPDMNDGQAINLNVNISDNIPSLLRSLQASRVITDELERFVSRP